MDKTKLTNKKGDIVIFAKINEAEYICSNPNQYKFGAFLDDTISVTEQSMGRLQESIKCDVSEEHYTDNLGNKYNRVVGDYTVVIRVELVGGRPPILKYP